MTTSTQRAADQISGAIKQYGVDRDLPAFHHARRDRLGGLRDRIAEPDPLRLRVPEGFRGRVGGDDAPAQCRAAPGRLGKKGKRR